MLRTTLFAYGFRPFFLLSGVFALIAVPAWLWMFSSGIALVPGLSSHFWHAHEMLYGFVVAAIAGFLLTAVPNWTGRRGFAGMPLVALVVAWLAGRLAIFFANFLPMPLIAVAELAFLPMLGGLLAPPIVQTRNRNLAMLFMLAALWLVDIVFFVGMTRGDASVANTGLLAAMNIVLALLTIIGGRIVPAFTANALRGSGRSYAPRSYPLVERVLPAAMLLNLAIDLLLPGSAAAGTLALFIAVFQGIRLAGWSGFKTFDQPIVWALHLGYIWIPLGFLLKSLALLADLGGVLPWQHAFGIGAFGGMILAVATRAALGHTGRPLVVHPCIAWAYGAMGLAALLRLAASWLPAHLYPAGLLAATLTWSAAFFIFLFVYGPILILPRADGKPG